MKKIITIVGCGAVGVSQLYHLTQELINNNIAEFFEIVIFEKSSHLGQGLAFASDEESNILNRNAETMSLIHQKPNDFINWLQKNKTKWKLVYPNFSINKSKEVFLPRSLFGLYCEDTLQQTMQYARKHKLKVSIIHDEIISINKHHRGYDLITNNDWKIYSHIVILTIGNLPSNKFANLAKKDKFICSPYPTQKLSIIPTNASVGILGSRLSAIDTAISLTSNGHKGSLSFISRNGYLPSIRSPYRHYNLKIITQDLLNKYLSSKDKLSLMGILKLIMKEIELACGEKYTFLNWLKRPVHPMSFLENELITYKTRQRVLCQAVLISLNQVIESIWHELKDIDKVIFNEFYKSKWMSYRVGIPLQNALKIYNLMINQQLIVISQFNEINRIENKFIVSTNASHHEFDYLIDATGGSDDIKLINSTLMKNLLSQGLIIPHRFGGIAVDFDTSKAISMSNSSENLYVIGNLTVGTYFFTSVLELNVKHSHKIAVNIVSDFLDSYQKTAYQFKPSAVYPLPVYQEQLM